MTRVQVARLAGVLGGALAAASGYAQQTSRSAAAQVSAADLVFTPVTPCRIINTRLAGGPIAAGTTRSFYAAGPDFSIQGGLAGSCGVPLGPTTAVVVNIVAVDAAGAGDLRAAPYGTAIPAASIINYAKASDQVNPSLVLNIANGLVLKI